MDINIPGVDAKKGLDLYDDEVDLWLRVLRSYAANTPAALDRMRNVSAETLADYASAVHGVKSTSANIGAEDTRAAALKLEMTAKAGDLNGVLANNKAFIAQTEELLAGIRAWLERHDAR